MMSIVTTQSPNSMVLKQSAKVVTFPLHPEVQTVIHAVKEKLCELDGVGLAAPQLGFSIRVIAIHITKEVAHMRDYPQAIPMTVLLNPEIEPLKSTSQVLDWEGCYSIQDWMGKAPRFQAIQYRGYNEQGEKISGIAD